MIHHGDLFNVLPTLEANLVDSCVTDPPYGIGDGTDGLLKAGVWYRLDGQGDFVDGG